MKNINFKSLLVATDIARKHCENKDYRESFANILYTNGSGIVSHVLAFKIYHSNEETEYTDGEIELIIEYANEFCKPFFIDAINYAIDSHSDDCSTDK